MDSFHPWATSLIQVCSPCDLFYLLPLWAGCSVFWKKLCDWLLLVGWVSWQWLSMSRLDIIQKMQAGSSSGCRCESVSSSLNRTVFQTISCRDEHREVKGGKGDVVRSGYHEQTLWSWAQYKDTRHQETLWREQETGRAVSTEERNEKSSVLYSHALSQAWAS